LVSEQGKPKKEGWHEIDAFTMLASKVNALFQKVDRLQPALSHGGTISGHLGKQVFVKCMEF